jgi:hypothetical protein
MSRILLAVDYSPHAKKAIESILFEGLAPETSFRVALISPRFNPGPSQASTLARPTIAFYVPRLTLPDPTFHQECRDDFIDRTNRELEHLARPFKRAGYAVESVIHEGSAFMAIRREIRSWCPYRVIVALSGVASIKTRLLQLTFGGIRAGCVDDNSQQPPLLRAA